MCATKRKRDFSNGTAKIPPKRGWEVQRYRESVFRPSHRIKSGTKHRPTETRNDELNRRLKNGMNKSVWIGDSENSTIRFGI
jgi:hypothetical protein